jgi:hypothetical protein
MSLSVLQVRRHGVIDGQDGDVLVCASVGPAGELVAVWTAPEGLEAVSSSTVSAAGASFPDPAATRPVAARITVHTPELVAVTRIADLTLPHITAQPMPGGKSERVLGDGIAHVLATSAGQVWVGYFDEGIYGNYGWGRADSQEPVGAYGIVQFSPDLEPAWHYPKYTEVGPWDAVSDCYALNVDEAGTWACYYSDFPAVRICDGAVAGWHNEIKGASALAVAGSRVALFGGYGPDRDRLALAELSADRAEPAGEYRVVLPDGKPLPQGTQVIGRGSCLHFLAGTSWYRLDVDDIPAEPAP